MRHHRLRGLLIPILLWSSTFSIGPAGQTASPEGASAGQQFFSILPLLPRSARHGDAVTKVKMQGCPSEEGFALVKARVAGSPALIFLIDTGFNGVLALDRSTAQKMKLLNGVETKRLHDIECAYFKSFTIGEITIDIAAVPTLLMDLGWMRELPGLQGVAGVIGFGFLRLFVTRIDYVQEMLTLEFNQGVQAAAYRVLVYDGGNKLVKIIPLTALESPVLHLPRGGRATITTPVPVPLNQDWLEQRGMPVVRATVNEEYVAEFLIDTGAHGTTIPRSLAEKIAFERKVGGFKTVVGNGQPVTRHAARVRSLVVGEKRLEQMVVYYFDHSPPPNTLGISVTLPQEMGVIGGDFLRHFEITIDGPRAVIYLEGPYPDLPEQRIWTEPNIGVGINYSEGRCVISIVLEPSPASESGIQVGDELIEIDGKPVQNLSSEDVQGSLIGPENSSVRLTIQRNGDRKCIEVRRRRLL